MTRTSTRRPLRWTFRVLGVALLLSTLAIGGYARLAGARVDSGMDVFADRTYYLAVNGGVAHCTVDGVTLDIQPIGGRELLDGRLITPSADSRLTCTGGDVTVTSGALLRAYPLAEHDLVPILLGATLIAVSLLSDRDFRLRRRR